MVSAPMAGIFGWGIPSVGEKRALEFIVRLPTAVDNVMVALTLTSMFCKTLCLWSTVIAFILSLK